MIIELTFKDPDGVCACIEDKVNEVLEPVKEHLSDSEIQEVFDIRRRELLDAISSWVAFDEYVTIEIDTKTNTARVLRA